MTRQLGRLRGGCTCSEAGPWARVSLDVPPPRLTTLWALVRCASISWFQDVTKWVSEWFTFFEFSVISIILQLAHLRVFQSYFWMKWKGAAGENLIFFHIVQKGADGVDVNEGCFSAKRFPRRGAQAPKNCPPSTANGTPSPATSPLRLSSRLQHGITWDWLRLHVGDGSHNHNCGERKYSWIFGGWELGSHFLKHLPI